jgi:hypothetical protein
VQKAQNRHRVKQAIQQGTAAAAAAATVTATAFSKYSH